MSEIRKFHIIEDDDPLLQPAPGSVAKAYSAMSADLAKVQAQVDALRAGLDRLQDERRRQDAAKAASDAFRKSQQ